LQTEKLTWEQQRTQLEEKLKKNEEETARLMEKEQNASFVEVQGNQIVDISPGNNAEFLVETIVQENASVVSFTKQIQDEAKRESNHFENQDQNESILFTETKSTQQINDLDELYLYPGGDFFERAKANIKSYPKCRFLWVFCFWQYKHWLSTLVDSDYEGSISQDRRRQFYLRLWLETTLWIRAAVLLLRAPGVDLASSLTDEPNYDEYSLRKILTQVVKLFLALEQKIVDLHPTNETNKTDDFPTTDTDRTSTESTETDSLKNNADKDTDKNTNKDAHKNTNEDGDEGSKEDTTDKPNETTETNEITTRVIKLQDTENSGTDLVTEKDVTGENTGKDSDKDAVKDVKVDVPEKTVVKDPVKLYDAEKKPILNYET